MLIQHFRNRNCFVQSKYVAKVAITQGPAHTTDHSWLTLQTKTRSEGGNTFVRAPEISLVVRLMEIR